MPVKIPSGLPAIQELAKESIFVMTEQRADTQDIRPLRIAILNLMPAKLATETQLLRVLGNTSLQVDITLLHTATYASKNTEKSHLEAFYQTWYDVKDQYYDGLVVTGAPVEQMAFEKVEYWTELCEVMDWSETHAFSTLYICWGAQAALYHFYDIPKRKLPKKLFGVYPHRRLRYDHLLLRGFDDVFHVPQSRHTAVDEDLVRAQPDLDILAVSEKAGMYLAATKDCSRIFVTGHSEYARETLEWEYLRDIAAGDDVLPPDNYYPEDDPSREPNVTWRAHGNLLFANWLNYCVYQETPFDVEKVAEQKAKKTM